ncbi:VCBS repeat protein [Frondihabitans sp. PhB188]|uniref:GH25 family lysozyme n=1 Tax=Frondihabitans sp. PhB188 TaxID=2485200 RepID=UPI000FBAC94A|nr:GH25 family lysozyme [Frondihabitans sp. PhB188]ROQ41148.1 VCBS repeat protein [Frondihabitans sp. PhB188]
MHRSIRRVAIVGLASLVVSGFVAVAGVAPADAATTAPTGIRGFDVSQYQGAISDAKWSSLYNGAYKARFVYIKASGGVKVVNDNFAAQWNGSLKAGYVRGAYHLAAPNVGTASTNAGRAVQQADYFNSQRSKTPQGALWSPGGSTLPPMLDLEVNTKAQQPDIGACYDMSQSEMRSWISAFSAQVAKNTTRIPVIYTNADFWARCVGSSTTSFTANPLFFAKYTSNAAAGPGAVPKNWAAWSLWQYSDKESPFPGDQDAYNGTMTSLRLLADPTYQFTNTPTTRLHDYNADGKTDILAITSTGTLYNYRGDGKGAFLSPANVSLGTGMNSYNAFAAVGKATSSGNPGLYARGTSGSLYYFPVSPKGSLGTRVTAASGWSTMTKIASAGDFNGDGYADITAVDKVGVLWLYLGDKTGRFSGRVQLASGWNSKNLVVGGSDFNGDGYSDLLARDSSGGLALYTHIPTVAGLVKTTVPQTGWSNYTKIFTPGDFTGDGNADLMAIGKSGQMYVFPGNGSVETPFDGRKAVGTTTSWGSRTFIG